MFRRMIDDAAQRRPQGGRVRMAGADGRRACDGCCHATMLF